jgi:hypothetical protein
MMTDIVSDETVLTQAKDCPLPYIAKPHRSGLRSSKILSAVAVKHNLQVADILGRDRFEHFVAARREAILAMHASGMTQATIASAMRRQRTTILEYTNPGRRERKKDYRRVAMAGEKWPTRCWSDEMDATLVALLDSGLSYNLIAGQMHITRGAVIGRVSRLGLRSGPPRIPTVIKKRNATPLTDRLGFVCAPSLRALIKEVAATYSATPSRYIRDAIIQRLKSDGFAPEQSA